MGPTPASRLVAKAWIIPVFKKRALEDPITASLEMGINWLDPTGFGTPSDFTALHILEDTPTLHHVVTCTLCSCYPRPILGTPLDGRPDPKLQTSYCSYTWRRGNLRSLVSFSPQRRRLELKIPTPSTGFCAAQCGQMGRRAGARSSWLRS